MTPFSHLQPQVFAATSSRLTSAAQLKLPEHVGVSRGLNFDVQKF